MSRASVRGRLKLGKWDLKVLLEVLVFGEEYKPFQVAKRMVLTKYGLLGTSKDRVFTAFLYNIWRLQGLIDKIICQVLGINVDKLHPWLRALLRLYTYQKLWAHKEHPDMTEWIEKYAPKVLREKASQGELVLWERYKGRLRRRKPPIDAVEEKFLVSRFIYEKLVAFIGRRETENLLSFLRDWVPPIPLRVNVLKASVEEVLEELKSLGVRAWRSQRCPVTVFAERGFDIKRLKALQEGKVIVQDEPSAIASIILNPKPGETVVDLCAAPGGKTTHLAELMGGKGVIYAFDIYPDRMERLKEVVRRHGVDTVVEPIMADGRQAPKLLGEEVADKVLVDPPCSSTGTIAKNPDVRWRINQEDLQKITQQQEQLLEAGIRLARPGGLILYTVCSLFREEGEDIVKRVLLKHPEVELVKLDKPYTQSPVLPGTMRAWPHKHQVTGFYYALLRKKA